MRIPPSKPHPELDALLRKSVEAYGALTPEERQVLHRVQRKSWVIGEMMLLNPEMSRGEAERIYDDLPD